PFPTRRSSDLLRVEPAGIIQARSSDRDKVRERVGLDLNRRAAFSAKAPMGLAARLTGRGMETQRALQELESFGRHDHVRRKRTSARSLAITTVTVKHHHRFCCGFVANRAASASATKGYVYCGHKTSSFYERCGSSCQIHHSYGGVCG